MEKIVRISDAEAICFAISEVEFQINNNILKLNDEINV
jgi:hypothetical protein